MRVFAVLLVSLLLAGPWAPAHAGETPSALGAPDRAAILGVIRHQLDAFRADDAGAAFADASPGIQGLFGDPAHFMAMVKSGYPMVYRPRAANFGALVEIDGRTVQQVTLVGQDGRPTLALYYMQRQPDGSWKIDGCQLTESPEVGA